MEELAVKVIIFGATGMVGHGVLLECLDAEDVDTVVSVARRTLDLEHPKLTQLVHADFTDFGAIEDSLRGADACFYCIGISSSGVTEARYREVTIDCTRQAVELCKHVAPDLTFCFVSGAGTALDSRRMWGRVKAAAEELVKDAGFPHAYCFRPAYIQPLRGVRSQVKSYRVMYAMLGPLYGLWRRFPKYVTSSIQVGQAMLNAVRRQPDTVTLENADIVRLSAPRGTSRARG